MVVMKMVAHLTEMEILEVLVVEGYIMVQEIVEHRVKEIVEEMEFLEVADGLVVVEGALDNLEKQRHQRMVGMVVPELHQQ